MNYPDKMQEEIKILAKSDDMLRKIFYVNVGPDVDNFTKLTNSSETQKWYLMSAIDRYLSSISDKKASDEMSVLTKKYMFPVSVMKNFPRYNPSVVVGWNVNTYGLDMSKVDVIVTDKINKATKQRDIFMKVLNDKGIKLNTPKKVSIDKSVKDMEAMLDTDTKEKIEKLYYSSDRKPDPKAVIRILAKKIGKR